MRLKTQISFVAHKPWCGAQRRSRAVVPRDDAELPARRSCMRRPSASRGRAAGCRAARREAGGERGAEQHPRPARHLELGGCRASAARRRRPDGERSRRRDRCRRWLRAAAIAVRRRRVRTLPLSAHRQRHEARLRRHRQHLRQPIPSEAAGRRGPALSRTCGAALDHHRPSGVDATDCGHAGRAGQRTHRPRWTSHRCAERTCRSVESEV